MNATMYSNSNYVAQISTKKDIIKYAILNMDNVNEGNMDKKEYDFYLDPSLIDLNIVKRIGIENFTNSIIVETFSHTVTRTIHLGEFVTKTILENTIKVYLSRVVLNNDLIMEDVI